MNISRTLFTSKTLSGGGHPIYLQLSHNGETLYFPIYMKDKRFRAYENQWDETKKLLKANKKDNPEYKILNKIIRKRENILYNLIEGMINDQSVITKKSINHRFYNIVQHNNVIDFTNELITKSNKVKSKNLEDVKKDLIAFHGNHNIKFADINYDFVNKYIRYQKEEKDRVNTTIGIRLRYLRIILNEGIKNNVGSKATYPFSSKYGALETINIEKYEKDQRKIDINPNLIPLLKSKNFENHSYEVAKRLFLVSFHGRGINFRDLALMTTDNIYSIKKANHLRYNRNKTGALIELKISDALQEQLDWFQTNTKPHGNYLFPIIDSTKDISDIFEYLTKELKKFDYRIKRVAEELNIQEPISSYVGRHLFSFLLDQNNVSLGKISQALGHKTRKATYHYLHRFKEDQLSEEIENIIG